MNLATFSGNHKSMPFLPFMANVVKEEGIKGLYSGLPAGLLRQVPLSRAVFQPPASLLLPWRSVPLHCAQQLCAHARAIAEAARASQALI